jgi:hypothetical protein
MLLMLLVTGWYTECCRSVVIFYVANGGPLMIC